MTATPTFGDAFAADDRRDALALAHGAMTAACGAIELQLRVAGLDPDDPDLARLIVSSVKLQPRVFLELAQRLRESEQ